MSRGAALFKDPKPRDKSSGRGRLYGRLVADIGDAKHQKAPVKMPSGF